MSYDLMVFEPAVAPREPKAFSEWYGPLLERGEYNYDDPANLSERLRAWYREMINKYPAMNGPDARRSFLAKLTARDRITGYACAGDLIYLDFRWNVAEAACAHVSELARKHHVGFFDASGEGEVWGPTSSGGYGLWFVAWMI